MTIRTSCLGVLLIAVAACTPAGTRPGSPAAAPPAKKLIEFGWDEPTTEFMRRHHAEMEQTPFDGCVFHTLYAKPDGGKGVFMWECWGRRAFTEDELRPALEDLRATPFRRFTHNFLRFNVTPADLDWFDDYAAVVQNARLAARVARDGRCAGVLFDIEQYNAPLFNYRQQRDAAAKPWDAYAVQVRRRGGEVMRAFQDGFPGLTIFLTYGYCLPWQESNGGKRPLADTPYGLLAPFLDGMLEAAAGGTRIVDGYEYAYGFKDTARFTAAHRTMREELLPMVAHPGTYRAAVSAGFGIWMDYDWRNKGWDVGDAAKNYYTPEAFEASVRAALAATDEYVWIYTEKPRWWSDGGGPVDLPAPYSDALRRARRAGGLAD